ncbi:MAG TPA: hypothetical protein VNM67_06710 [Thermoanaerobaculia bacterium]|jgi:hypothetical protein|nr:hypothetical protein [Thermoanaerobaculia bacterium]
MPLILVLALLLSGCGLSSALRDAKDVASPSVSGELAVRAPQGEPVAWKPNACLSGEHEQFFGFILASEGSEASDGSPVVLRAVVDPLDGPGLRVVGVAGLPGTAGVVFRPDMCERLELVVEPTGWRVNEIQDLSGKLDVSCRTADGGSVEGSVEVRHCH